MAQEALCPWCRGRVVNDSSVAGRLCLCPYCGLQFEMPPLAINTRPYRRAEGEVRCPSCRSDQVTYQRRGVSVGKAAIGALVLGPLGLLAGGHGKNRVQLTCLHCGHQWLAGRQ